MAAKWMALRYTFFTTPLTFNLIVSMLSSPSLSATFTAIVCAPALKVYACLLNFDEIQHYQKIIAVLTETILIQEEMLQ
jgi:hypothetical protein